jgi:hypothetical protein
VLLFLFKSASFLTQAQTDSVYLSAFIFREKAVEDGTNVSQLL